MSHRVTFLWTVPRSVSTSFERMMMERGDHVVFDEPFSRAYYFGPDRQSPRYTETLPDSSVAEILAQIDEAARERPVFVKDMAYQAVTVLGPDLLKRFHNCFLVRDPAATIRSLARRWPDFTDDETGWSHLGQVASLVESLGQQRVVLDANLLCADPPAVVEEWCRRMDLPYLEEAMTWEGGMRDEWELWSEWHDSTTSATGFAPLREPPPPPTPDEPRLHEAYQAALPLYLKLRADAITGTGEGRRL